MSELKKIKLYLLDDHMLIRDGIKAMFQNENYIEVVGDQSVPDGIVERIIELEVDVLLLDMFLPDLEGLRIAKKVTEKTSTAVLVLSSNTDEELILGAFQNGALGYIQKDISKEELVAAIYEVIDGKEYVSHKIRNNLSANFIRRAKYGDKYSQSKLTCLSEREIEVIKYMAQGMVSKEIAKELDVSHRTIEAHKRNILEKLELTSVVDVVVYALKNKIIDV